MKKILISVFVWVLLFAGAAHAASFSVEVYRELTLTSLPAGITAEIETYLFGSNTFESGTGLATSDGATSHDGAPTVMNLGDSYWQYGIIVGSTSLPFGEANSDILTDTSNLVITNSTEDDLTIEFENAFTYSMEVTQGESFEEAWALIELGFHVDDGSEYFFWYERYIDTEFGDLSASSDDLVTFPGDPITEVISLVIPANSIIEYRGSVDAYGYAKTPAAPEPTIDDILTFFDQSVANGTLEGYGPGNSANGRLNALRNMLEMAGDLIAIGDIEDACGQLKSALNKCDGETPPPDFVTGEGVEGLHDMILELMAKLGCE